MRIYREFHFEAAHFLPSAPPGHRNARVHGHSFRVRVSVDGEPDPETGLVMHLDELSAAIADAREELSAPTLERLSIWLWNKLQNRLPGLAEILISRDTCQEGCIYAGPGRAARLAAE